MKIEYPFVTFIYKNDDKEDQYYTYLPDFGHSACSFVGDDFDESVQGIRNVLDDLYPYYRSEMPIPGLFDRSYSSDVSLFCDMMDLSKETTSFYESGTILFDSGSLDA